METEELLEKDEDLKATESRIVELRQKKERTEEEEKEFSDLRKHHRGRVQEQIANEREIAKKETERAAKAEQALEEAQRRLEELRQSREEQSSSGANENEMTNINGKKFYTDEAISIRVEKGLMTRSEGWKMQREAIKEEAKAEMKGDAPKEEATKTRKESLDYVNKEGYGHFLNDKDPKHNPNDPLYKEANRLWFNGYQYHPDGPRLALEDARKNLNIGIKRPDLSEELGAPRNNAASEGAAKSKKVELSDIETQNAIRYYVYGNVINPKTNKHYTEQEALTKALDAKRKRSSK